MIVKADEHMSDFNYVLFFGVLIGIVAYIMLYIGKGIQKYAIEGFKVDKTIKSKHSGVWIGGTILTALFVFVQWIPLSLLHTPMNMIAPLEGIGLITLLIFSFFVLKEKISIIEAIAVILIITGTILINVVAVTPEELQRESANFVIFGIILGVMIGVFGLLYLLVFKRSDTISGIVLGLAAGSFMAFQTLAKRITDIDGLVAIFTFVMFLFAILTLALTQFALSKTRANIVIPCFTSTSIILTTILGVYVIDEAILPIQIAGIIVIVVGIILMNIQIGSKEDGEIEETIEPSDGNKEINDFTIDEQKESESSL